MIEVFHDRITDEDATSVPRETLSGRWQLRTELDASLNSLAARRGDFLIPDSNGGWSLRITGEDRLDLSGRLTSVIWSNEAEIKGIGELGNRLHKLVQMQAGWDHWIHESPLVEVMKIVSLSPFERQVQENLAHLEEVCSRPRAYLRIDEERMPVSRVRRFPPRALDTLASRPEDWEHRKWRNILPQRLVGFLPDDELDLYENRLATRLVEKLARYLRQRLSEVRKIEREIDKIQKARDEHLKFSTFPRLQRISSLLVDVVDAAAAQKEANTTKKVLENLYYRVMGLFGSSLYKAIPRNASISPVLQTTNILVNDTNYRQVGMLWQSALINGIECRKSLQDSYDERQNACRAFNLFCRLLVFRALRELRYAPASAAIAVSEPAQEIELSGPAGQANLKWQADGVITLTLLGEKPACMRLIPLLEAFTAISPPEWTKSQIADLTTICQPRQQKHKGSNSFADESRIIIYPATFEDREHLQDPQLLQRLTSVGNDLAHSFGLGFIPVSTREFDSVERVARALRWTLWGHLLLSYPPRISIPTHFADAISEVTRPWLQSASDSGTVVEIPAPNSLRDLNKWLTDTTGRLRSRGKQAERDLRALESFEQGLRGAFERLEQIQQCPVCFSRSTNKQALTSADQGCFACECSVDKCGAMWGINICGVCHERFPYLIPGRLRSQESARSAGWVDDVIGCDVLAVPCWVTGAERTFICPNCGRCSKDQQSSAGHCARCHDAGVSFK